VGFQFLLLATLTEVLCPVSADVKFVAHYL